MEAVTMSDRMKLLLGYDGSECADAALDDLKRAGLPATVEAQVLVVAEVWLPPPSIGPLNEKVAEEKVPADLKRLHVRTAAIVKEAQTMAEAAGERLERSFPQWEVRTKVETGSPAWELLFFAGEFEPDLIVMGSHGRSALGRFVLGSISQKVLGEAGSSVRIARGRVEDPDAPVRIVVGIDGSPGSMEAVRSVASRNWPQGSEISVVVVTDPWKVPVIASLVPQLTETIDEENKAEIAYAGKIAAEAEAMLANIHSLKVRRVLREGDPKRELPEFAEEWGADSIFVGSTGFSNRLERVVLGSVSAAVAARAHCSVEVVRSRSKTRK
jgi:nucleotide-binding universal stress UspA family protein